MEERDSWLERRPLRNLCTHIRRSLSEATKVQEEQTPQTPASPQIAEEESSLASKGGSSRIWFECGYAMFSEKQNYWILRHRGTTVAPTSSRKRNDSFDSLSCTGTPSSLPLRNARRVARIWPSVRNPDDKIESASASSATLGVNFPPTNLLQKVLRAIELRSMFEQVQFSLAKDPPGPPQCLSRMGRTKIDFAPMLAYMNGNCGGRKTPQDLLQEAILAVEKLLERGHDSWTVKVDTIEELTVPQHIAGVTTDVLASFINKCLAQELQEAETNTRQLLIEDSTIQNTTAGQPKPPEVLQERLQPQNNFESKGAQLPGERSAPTSTSVPAIPPHTSRPDNPNQQPGQPSIAIQVNLDTYCSKGENTSQIVTKKNKSNPDGDVDNRLPQRKRGCDEIFEEVEERCMNDSLKSGKIIGHVPERRASKRRKTPERLNQNRDVCHGGVIDAFEGPQKLRRSSRTVSGRWIEDGPNSSARAPGVLRQTTQFKVVGEKVKARSKTLELEDASRGQDSRKRNGESRRVPSSYELRCQEGSGSSTETDTVMECAKNVDPLSLQRQSSEWVRLSHFGHVSDYHGFERKYAFLPLRWDRSLNDMGSAIEATLRANHFDETAESDEEFVAENHWVMEHSPKAKAERILNRPSVQKCTPEDETSGLTLHPVVFDQRVDGPVPDGCQDPKCSLCSSKSETIGLHHSKNQGTFREVEFDPLDFGSENERSKSGRPSRSKEIVAQRKASLLMLNELRHTFEFISSYNKGFAQLNAVDQESQCNGADSLDGLNPEESCDDGSSLNKKKGSLENLPESEPNFCFDDPQSSTDRQCTIPKKPSLVQLSHLAARDEYLALKQRKISPLFWLPKTPTLCELQDSVYATISEQYFGAADEDILNEQKTFVRAIRTYNGKADQERIEKTKHEEERKLQLRELEYRNRGKKPSAEEMEFVNFENRPVLFISPSELKECRLGESCNICADNPDSSAHIKCDVIFHPTVQRVDDSYLDDNSDLCTRRSRTYERSVQRELAVDTLTTLQHRIKFIEQYNQGWIMTMKRRN